MGSEYSRNLIFEDAWEPFRGDEASIDFARNSLLNEDTRRKVRENDPTLTVLKLQLLDVIRGEEARRAIHAFADALRENTTVIALVFQLQTTTLGATGVSAFAEALRKNRTLKWLSFAGEEIGDAGGASIANALPANNALTHLDLTGNRIGKIGASALARAILENDSLAQLRLGNNDIGHEGASAFASALRVNTTLSRLDLDKNKISDSGVGKIANALSENDTLKWLSLNGNGIGFGGASALGVALRLNNTLERLSLASNDVGNVAAALLANALRENTTLRFLDLRKNMIDEEGWKAFADAVPHNHNIRYLGLHPQGSNRREYYGNKSSPNFLLTEESRQIDQVLERNRATTKTGGTGESDHIFRPHVASVPEVSSITYGTFTTSATSVGARALGSALEARGEEDISAGDAGSASGDPYDTAVEGIIGIAWTGDDELAWTRAIRADRPEASWRSLLDELTSTCFCIAGYRREGRGCPNALSQIYRERPLGVRPSPCYSDWIHCYVRAEREAKEAGDVAPVVNYSLYEHLRAQEKAKVPDDQEKAEVPDNESETEELPSIKSTSEIVSNSGETPPDISFSSHNHKVKELHLDCNFIDDEDAMSLAKILHCDADVWRLCLRYNLVGDTGAVGLAEVLRKNSTISYLALEGNMISSRGVAAIARALVARALERKETLEQLELSMNAIGAEGAAAMSVAIRHNTSLTSLKLDCCRLGDEGAILIAKSLRANRALSGLYLRGNSVSNAGAEAFIEALRSNVTLSKLDLRGNGIDSGELLRVERSLLENARKTFFPNPPVLCKMGCGFFGSNATGDCCLVCWRRMGRAPDERAPLEEEVLVEMDLVRYRNKMVAQEQVAETTKKPSSMASVSKTGKDADPAFIPQNYRNIEDEGALEFDKTHPSNGTLTELDCNIDLGGDGIDSDELQSSDQKKKKVTNSTKPRTLITRDTPQEVPGLRADEMSPTESIEEDHSTVISANTCGEAIGEKRHESLAVALCGKGTSKCLDELVAQEAVKSPAKKASTTVASTPKNKKDDDSTFTHYRPAFEKAPLSDETLMKLDLGGKGIDSDTEALSRIDQQADQNKYQDTNQTKTCTSSTSDPPRGRSVRVGGLGADERSLIERVEEDHSTVTSVNLCDKSIGDEGAKLLSASLCGNGSVKELRLNNSCIGDKGVMSLADVLCSNSSITKICLRRNNITDTGAAALAEALSKNSSVECFALARNKVAGKGAVAIAKALRTNTTLAELELSKNTLGARGGTQIASSLRTNTSLKCLKLDNCYIGTEGTKEIAKALRHNQTLAKLYLRGNKIGNDGAEEFVEALRFNETLTRLDLSDNGVDSDELLSKIQKLLERNKERVASAKRPWTSEERNRICVLFSDPLVWRHNDGSLNPITEKLRLGHERRMIGRCMESKKNIKLSFDVATDDRLQEIAAARCGCLHFSGHGLPGTMGNSHLMFEDRMGGAHFLSREELSALLCFPEPFRVVFVSACYSLPIGEAFVKAGTKHVVCCEQDSELNDGAALEFTRAFYGSLVGGFSVSLAFNLGKGAVFGRYTRDEAEKFVLLPANHDHDVPVFDACYVKQCEDDHLLDNPSIPSAPTHFVGRECAMYDVFNSVLSERLVTVVGPQGVGLSSFATSLCHYMHDRLRTIPNFESILFVNRNRAASGVRTSLLVPLFEQLVAEGKAENSPGKGFLEEGLCRALNGTNALVVFDDVRGLEADLCSFLPFFFERVKAVAVLLTAGKPTGFSWQSVVEEVVELRPLGRNSAAELFIKRCPHAVVLEERDQLRRFLLSEMSAVIVSERIETIVRAVGTGIPSKIIQEAKSMSDEVYQELVNLCPH